MTEIVGYIPQTGAQIEAINLLKQAESECVKLVDQYLTTTEIGVDKRCMSLAKTNIQQAFMWAVRAVAKPNGEN